ncbi:hypothetical protein PRUPE_7G026500 [Prunus persica]|uniref:GrpE protein homolog n=1 Tax=Prunus persica TaxID=3760 RepID=M5VQG4_PRUPE|nr:uncharacterized protein LOC18769280 isoform X1 [Prunus persica]XP_020423993.1 uncharacterized protein LOC18769280 isoform X1 [Prunus persica]ONH94690.1 hypothetical protein PRUPE_7G026500 [Prunus persica]ONH94691.1 hypothetical protein PRUPE_7G026500 [Prunus persica]
MANVLRTSPLGATFAQLPSTLSPNSPKPSYVSFRQSQSGSIPYLTLSSLRFPHLPSLRFAKFVPLASQGETETTETVEEVRQPEEIEDSSDGAVSVEDSTSDGEESGTSNDDEGDAEEKPVSAIIASLQLYKEALASNDESKVAEIESFLKYIEDEKISLEKKVASLSEELSAEKVRILRISADFENFRKRTDRERISLVTNAQGEVVESLLPVVDNFERAKTQIKVETEGEEKINNSYQSIYKQFGEILSSLGVVPVETVGKPFDPLLHEAIMREDSTEFEEGVIIDEFRKGFKLGDRLLRPSMVKVSAGPGPAKPDQQVPPSEEQDASETTKEGSTETESA